MIRLLVLASLVTAPSRGCRPPEVPLETKAEVEEKLFADPAHDQPPADLHGPPARPEATPPDPAAAIRKVVQQNAGMVKRCYDRALKRDGQLAGRVGLEVEIVRGWVDEVVLVEDEPGSPPLADCIRSAVAGWRFPEDVSDTVYLPFVLNAG